MAPEWPHQHLSQFEVHAQALWMGCTWEQHRHGTLLLLQTR